MKQLNLLDELIIDSFAGGGGASTGIELATGRPVDIAINHDIDAIAMHKVNHPYTKHYCESVWDIDPRKACKGRNVALAWFSPDCKHFSKAKGGKPVDKNIRGLAWVAVRWAATVHPRVIMMENVEEIMTWCPLTKDGYPDFTKKGRTFNSFVNALREQGYEVEYKILKACDYGAPTIRKRFVLIARCDGKPIVFPKPTHGVGQGLKPYRTAAEIIDWSIPCPSIFDTSQEIKEKFGVKAVRPLAENTMQRIARGIQKFVIENPKPFIIQQKFSNTPQDVSKPMSTITSVGAHCLVTPIMAVNNSNHPGGKVDEPIKTITTGGHHCLVTPYMTAIGQTGFTSDRSYGVDEPVRTIVSKAEQCLVTPTIIQYHSETLKDEVRGQSIGEPMLTIDSSPRYGLISAFISRQFSNSIGHKADDPLGTCTAVDKSNLVQAFLIKYYGQCVGQGLDKPLDTIVSRDRFGLVMIEGTAYKIVDIGMRMLEPKELYAAQGFPLDYKIEFDVDGKKYSKAKQVARCGNAVCPPMATALVKANLPELCGKKIETMQELENIIAV